MTSAARVKRHRDRAKQGLVHFTRWIPAALRDDIEAMADRMVAEWTARQADGKIIRETAK